MDTLEMIRERRKAFLQAKREAFPDYMRLVPKAELCRADVRYWQIMGKYRELGARNRRDAFRLIQGGAA